MKIKFKGLLTLFVIGIFLAGTIPIAYSEIVEATFGNKDSNNNYRLKATRDSSGGFLTFTSALMWPYEAYTSSNTNNTLGPEESGKLIIDFGGSAGAVTPFGSKHILPRAAAGLSFKLCTGAEITATLDTVDAADTITYSVSGTELDAGDSIKSTGESGECVTVFSAANNYWTIAEMSPAVWTDNGAN